MKNLFFLSLALLIIGFCACSGTKKAINTQAPTTDTVAFVKAIETFRNGVVNNNSHTLSSVIANKVQGIGRITTYNDSDEINISTKNEVTANINRLIAPYYVEMLGQIDVLKEMRSYGALPEHSYPSEGFEYYITVRQGADEKNPGGFAELNLVRRGEGGDEGDISVYRTITFNFSKVNKQIMLNAIYLYEDED